MSENRAGLYIHDWHAMIRAVVIGFTNYAPTSITKFFTEFFI